ncbi:hypothetical protein GmHk_15G044835 [Glycine max]|nr:hypothetical protein GmHk_15G044835 [Glycine max]
MHVTTTCLRDSNGKFIAAMSSSSSTGTSSPLHVETRALYVALQWLSSRHHINVIVKTDCMQIVDVMKARKFHNNEVGDILRSCSHKISNLHNYKVQFVSSQVNQVAHT